LIPSRQTSHFAPEKNRERKGEKKKKKKKERKKRERKGKKGKRGRWRARDPPPLPDRLPLAREGAEPQGGIEKGRKRVRRKGQKG